MMNRLIEVLFGCSHHRTTFPLTPGRRGGPDRVPSDRRGTYVVCLDCGREFAYNWDKMQVSVALPERAADPPDENVFRHAAG